jgi:hypothetical protein
MSGGIMLSGIFEKILELAALILSVVNAVMLLRSYLRDRAVLTVSPVHPEVYQWWFRLPNSEFQGIPTRRYGFLTYIAIGNRGLRKTSLDSWRLFIKTHANRTKQELKPLSIPEPIFEAESFSKVYPVLGTAGLTFKGETVVDAGCGVSGWAYYVAEYYGSEKWSPVIEDEKIVGTLVVRDIFGGKAKTKITFSKREMEYISALLPGIEKIGQE